MKKLFIVLMLITNLVACQKEYLEQTRQPPPISLSISEAKAWFEQHVQAGDAPANPTAKMPERHIRRVSPSGSMRCKNSLRTASPTCRCR